MHDLTGVYSFDPHREVPDLAWVRFGDEEVHGRHRGGARRHPVGRPSRGGPFRRICRKGPGSYRPEGDEPRLGRASGRWPHDATGCNDCAVALGALHVLGCDREQCPLCHGQLIGCRHGRALRPGAEDDPEYAVAIQEIREAEEARR